MKVEPIAIQVFRRATGIFAIVASAQDLSRVLDAPIQDARYFTNQCETEGSRARGVINDVPTADVVLDCTSYMNKSCK